MYLIVGDWGRGRLGWGGGSTNERAIMVFRPVMAMVYW